MDVIKNWLKGSRDYTSGVKLYLEHGRDPVLIRLFTVEGYSEFKHNRLVKALMELKNGKSVQEIDTKEQKIAIDATKVAHKAAKVENAATSTAQVPAAPERPKKRLKWSENPDEVEKALISKWKPLHSELLDLQIRVGSVARQGEHHPVVEQEAGKMALRIIELDRMCDDIYAERDYYLQHRKLPEAAPDIQLAPDPRDWPKKLQNHMRYVRDYRTKLDSEQDPDKKIKLAGQLMKQEEIVAAYKKQMNLE